jgi:hypothetical protein
MSGSGQGLKNSERTYLVRTTSETGAGHIGGTFEKCHKQKFQSCGVLVNLPTWP